MCERPLGPVAEATRTKKKLASVQTSLFLCLLRSCRRSQCRSAFVRGHALRSAPEATHLFLTRQRMTHSASWMERSASSITSLLEPRTTMLTVFPGLAQPVICRERRINVSHGPQRAPRRCDRGCTYLDQLSGAFQADLLRQLRRAEHLWGEVVDVGDGLGANRLGGEGF